MAAVRPANQPSFKKEEHKAFMRGATALVNGIKSAVPDNQTDFLHELTENCASSQLDNIPLKLEVEPTKLDTEDVSVFEKRTKIWNDRNGILCQILSKMIENTKLTDPKMHLIMLDLYKQAKLEVHRDGLLAFNKMMSHFQRTNHTTQSTVVSQLMNMTKYDETAQGMEEYIQEIAKRKTNLVSHVPPLELADAIAITVLLRGLPPAYDPLLAALSTRNKSTFVEATAQVIQYRDYLEQQAVAPLRLVSDDFAINMAKAKRDRAQHDKRKKTVSTLPKILQATEAEKTGKCRECGKTGHAKRTCLSISTNKEILTAHKEQKKSDGHVMFTTVDSDAESDCDGLIDQPEKRPRHHE